MAIQRKNSPYSAALTGCSFMFYEMNRCLPLLLSSDAQALMKQEIEENKILLVNSLVSRQRFVAEFQRRFNAVPRNFWIWYQTLEEKAQRAALFYVIMKTYRLVFDFHFNVVVKKWRMAERIVTKSDILMEINEISGKDDFVDSWSDKTKNKCAVQFMTFLRQSGLMDERTNEIHPLQFEPADVEYYFNTGDEWFLEAALLFPDEIETLKSQLQ